MSPPIGSARAGIISQVDGIPDSGLFHNYDWSADSTTTSTVPDLTGSTDLTGTFTDLNSTINGVQAGSFDGVDDLVDGDFSDLSEPYDVFVVFRFVTTDSDQRVFDGFNNLATFYSGGSSNYTISQGGSFPSYGEIDTNNHIATTRWASSTDILRLDGAEVINTDSGSAALDGLTVGADNGGNNNGNLKVGQVLVYDPSVNGYSVTDVESYLSDKWGVAV